MPRAPSRSTRSSARRSPSALRERIEVAYRVLADTDQRRRTTGARLGDRLRRRDQDRARPRRSRTPEPRPEALRGGAGHQLRGFERGRGGLPSMGSGCGATVSAPGSSSTRSPPSRRSTPPICASSRTRTSRTCLRRSTCAASSRLRALHRPRSGARRVELHGAAGRGARTRRRERSPEQRAPRSAVAAGPVERITDPERADRLARAILSDVMLYNPEKLRAGIEADDSSIAYARSSTRRARSTTSGSTRTSRPAERLRSRPRRRARVPQRLAFARGYGNGAAAGVGSRSWSARTSRPAPRPGARGRRRG